MGGPVVARAPAAQPNRSGDAVCTDPRWSGSFSGQIEHQLFSSISVNWRGRPLDTYQVVIETIAATTTITGLTVDAVLDLGTHPTGVKVTKAEVEG